MAKLNVTVENGLDDVKLESSEKLKRNKKDKEIDKKKVKKEKKQKKEKIKKENYFSGIVKEMKLVTWPTKKNLVKYSISTIIMIIVLALFFIGITALFDLLYSLVQGWLA